MPQAVKYDNFAVRKQKLERRTRLSDTDIEDLKLAAFEQGFAAGWEDAVKAHADGAAERNDEIIEALRDAEFSLSEARRGLLDALTPLFTGIVTAVLPSVAGHALPLHVSEQLKQMSASALDQKIEVEVAADIADKIEDLLKEHFGDALTVVPSEEKTLLGARLRVGQQERELDLGRIVKDIEQSLAATLHSLKQETSHG